MFKILPSINYTPIYYSVFANSECCHGVDTESLQFSYTDIQEHLNQFKLPNFTFYNIKPDYYDNLCWLIPRLISEGIFVSLLFDVDSMRFKIPEIPCSRLILNTKIYKIPHTFTSLRENDVVILSLENMNQINIAISELSGKVNCIVLYNSNTILESDMLNNCNYLAPFKLEIFINNEQ